MPKYGEQTSCRLCGQDIEWHGRKHGWVDRGGNRGCVPYSEHGEIITPPKNAKHKPGSTVPIQLETYLDGLDAFADGRGFDGEHETARRYVEGAVLYATIRRDALERIANWPVNANSDPETMGQALDNIKDLAFAALGGAD